MAHSNLFKSFLQDIPRSMPSADVAVSLNAIARPMRTNASGMLSLGNGGDMLVYLGSGATKLIANTSGGREQIVAFHFAGDFFSVPANAWHSYSLYALTETQALAFPMQGFLEYTENSPAFHNILLARSLTALHRSRDKTVGLGRKSAEERLASFLVSMSERIETVENGNCVLELPMSRRDIGDSLGLTIETISRQFGNLRKAGLVETIGRSRVVLMDITRLIMRAGHI